MAKKGFTLIELVVALGLFSVLLLLTAGGFVRSLRTERQASAFTFVNSSLSIAMEQIAKELRTGRNYSTPSPSTITFVNGRGNTVTYCLDSAALKRNSGSGCQSGQKITGENVNVQYAIFSIQNSSGYPPRITILVGANPKSQQASSYMVNLQTTVSSRMLAGLR